VTTALALYAGFVSTLAIGWQIVSWRLSRRTLLRINLSRHIFKKEDEAGRLQVVDDNIIVSVINLSEHPVRITKARLANTIMIDRPGGVDWLFAVPPADPNVPVLDLADPLARVVEARDSIEAVVPIQALAANGIQAWMDVQVYVLTPTGMWFSSDGDAWPEESQPPRRSRPSRAREPVALPALHPSTAKRATRPPATRRRPRRRPPS
jgi:hypothetical protein